MKERKRILITGVAGFMGSHIARKFCKMNKYDVFGVDDLSGGKKDNIKDIDNLKFFQVDLRSDRASRFLINEVRPHYIYHLAANARECASFFQPLDVMQRNIVAYMNVLQPSISNGLEKIVTFLSMSIYGDQKPPFDETYKFKPVDPYAVSKVSMAEVTKQLADVHGFKWTLIVPRNVYGSFQSLNDRFRNVIGITMNYIMCGEDVVIYGTGKQVRSFSYIENSLPCYVKCLEPKFDGELINIGGMVPETINAVVDMIISNFPNYKGKVVHLPKRHGEVFKAYASYQKSIDILGYKEKYSLEQGIRKMAKWAKEKGPQEWTKEKLVLYNDKAPITWK